MTSGGTFGNNQLELFFLILFSLLVLLIKCWRCCGEQTLAGLLHSPLISGPIDLSTSPHSVNDSMAGIRNSWIVKDKPNLFSLDEPPDITSGYNDFPGKADMSLQRPLSHLDSFIIAPCRHPLHAPEHKVSSGYLLDDGLYYLIHFVCSI